MLGLLVEGFGVLNLFGNMFPLAFSIACSLPLVGPVLSDPRFPTAARALAAVAFVLALAAQLLPRSPSCRMLQVQALDKGFAPIVIPLPDLICTRQALEKMLSSAV